MNKKYFEIRVNSLSNELIKNKKYLAICTIDEVIKNNDIDKISLAKSPVKDIIYLTGEVIGTSSILKPRFKFNICTLDEYNTLTKKELNTIIMSKMKKSWDEWIKKYLPNNNPLSDDFQKGYMKNLENRYMSDCFNTIDI